MKRILLLILILLPIHILNINGQLKTKLPNDFDFLIGEWQCTIKSLNNTGEYQTSEFVWKAFFTADSNMVQDEVYIFDKEGKEHLWGVTYRGYSKQEQIWKCRFFDVFSGNWNTIDGSKKGEDIHLIMEGKNSNGEFTSKVLFYEIGENSFKWKNHISYDKGETWTENQNIIEAIRLK